MGSKPTKQQVQYNLPNLNGKIAIVTGANTGLGLASSKILAKRGATVIMACRSKERGQKALEEVQKLGKAELRLLDLSDLDSVAAFAEEIKAHYSHIDYLLNNAGIMACPQGKTKQGMDLQIGTNHFGPYALTMRLLPLLRNAPAARITSVASIAAEQAAPKAVPWDDYMFQGKGKYDTWKVYGTSKLFNIYFTKELQNRLDAAGITNVTATVAHPGWTTTDLQRHSGFASFAQKFISTMEPEDGCKPQVLALIGTHVEKGTYLGPKGQFTGPPAIEKLPKQYKVADERKLWAESEKLTGLKFPF